MRITLGTKYVKISSMTGFCTKNYIYSFYGYLSTIGTIGVVNVADKLLN